MKNQSVPFLCGSLLLAIASAASANCNLTLDNTPVQVSKSCKSFSLPAKQLNAKRYGAIFRLSCSLVGQESNAADVVGKIDTGSAQVKALSPTYVIRNISMGGDMRIEKPGLYYPQLKIENVVFGVLGKVNDPVGIRCSLNPFFN